MFYFLIKFRFLVAAIAALFFFGCADVSKKVEQQTQKMTRMMARSDLPEPIATSLDQMPDDAALVAKAIQERIAGSGQGRVQNVRFAGDVEPRLTRPWPTEAGFIPTGAQLYLHQAKADDPEGKTTSGRLDFEGPFGRRASVRYEAFSRTDGNGILIEEAHITPIYATFLEPLLLVVPAKALPADADRYPGTYGGLLQYVGARAIHSTETASVFNQQEEYVFFVFFLDQVSDSADINVKISDEPSGIYGYSKSTRYVNFEGWRVGLLAGQFAQLDDKTSSPLYVKAVFTPGKETGFLHRNPKLVGLFNISGSSP